MKIKPLNRHLVVEKVEEKKEKKDLSGFVVPEEFRPKDEYSVVKVLDIAEDSKFEVSWVDRKVIVETNMLFEVVGSTLILENYVYGLVDEEAHV
tara:strand:+ start:345 stop:626 length:282 start_codon:yes stop_codon:yes gene_type:complete